jgi:uncharacterized protein with PQ loop repeat
MQMNMPDLIGLTGAVIAGYAYLPQIAHLTKEHCSAGISRTAFALWFLSSLLVTTNAIFIQAVVFIILGVIQISATAIIYFYSTRYKGLVCPFHEANTPRA